ncbi:MAG: hypothetical protein DRN30_03005, partial [Thermoplasmata archaeon]
EKMNSMGLSDADTEVDTNNTVNHVNSNIDGTKSKIDVTKIKPVVHDKVIDSSQAATRTASSFDDLEREAAALEEIVRKKEEELRWSRLVEKINNLKARNTELDTELESSAQAVRGAKVSVSANPRPDAKEIRKIAKLEEARQDERESRRRRKAEKKERRERKEEKKTKKKLAKLATLQGPSRSLRTGGTRNTVRSSTSTTTDSDGESFLEFSDVDPSDKLMPSTSHSHSQHIPCDNSERTHKAKSPTVVSGLYTRASETVKNTQRWAHSAIEWDLTSEAGLRFVDLDFKLLMTGEMEIITDINTSAMERAGRLRLMKTVSYLSLSRQWEEVQNAYASVLRRIEAGRADWTTDFQSIIDLSLMLRTKKMATKQPTKSSKADPADKWFCTKYQNGTCVLEDQHKGYNNGKQVTFHHICAKCYLNDHKVQLKHPESSPTCPQRN